MYLIRQQELAGRIAAGIEAKGLSEEIKIVLDRLFRSFVRSVLS